MPESAVRAVVLAVLSAPVLVVPARAEVKSQEDGVADARQLPATDERGEAATSGVTSAAAAPASAETDSVIEPRHFLDRPFSMNLALGTGTVVGGLGGIVEYSIWQRFAVGGGLGVSWVGEERVLGGGLQGGAFGRFRLQTWEGEHVSHALTTVGGFSTGHFHYPILSGDGPSVSEQAYWVQLAFDYELLTRGGFRLTTGVGAAILAATSGVENTYASLGGDTNGLPRLFLSVDLTVGYAL